MTGLIPLFSRLAVLLMLCTPGVNAGLVFNFTTTTFNPGATGVTQTEFEDAFRLAGSLWSQHLADDIEVFVDIGFDNLGGGGVLGQAGSVLYHADLGLIRGGMVADQTSVWDAQAIAEVPTTQTTMLRNRTLVNGNSATPYLDTTGYDNTRVNATWANYKALGLVPGNSTNGTDGVITFNSNYAFDFDRGDGIAATKYDFVGVAAHELGHVLGYHSAVAALDQTPGGSENPYIPTTIDLFRYSADSVALNAIDITADTRHKYFSLDGGATQIEALATGTNFGDGFQPGHWKNHAGPGAGIMDPAVGPGVLMQVTQLDLQMLDVIGYDLQAVIPEPNAALLLLPLVVVVVGQRRERRFLCPDGSKV